MVKKALKLILVVIIIMCTTGCWDSLDIDNRDIITAVVLDYKDGQYSFCVEVATIRSKTQSSQNQNSNGQGSMTTYVSAKGETLAAARMNIDKRLNKPIFLGAVQALVITEDMANHGIEEYVYRVRQLNEYRKTMDVVVTPDNPEDFLTTQSENESTVGFAVEDTLDTMEREGETFHISLANLLEKLSCRNPCYLMSTLSNVDGQLSLIGYTVFDGGQRIGFIPYEQSRGIVYIAEGKKGQPVFEYNVPYDDGQVCMRVELKSMNITADYDGSTTQFRVNMKFNGRSLYPSSNIAITPEIKSVLKEGLKQQLLRDISETIRRSQEYGCDYLSFNEYFRIRYPNIFEQMDWGKEFSKASFTVSIGVDIVANESVDYNPYKEGKQQ